MQRAVSWAAKLGSTPRPALVRVQATPSRRTTSLPRLLERLDGLEVEVFEHESHPANPWVNYRRCLEDIGDHEHVLVIQDDAVPCRNLAAVLPRFQMDIPVCLFLPNMPMQTRPYARQAIIAGDHWVELRLADWLPAVATLWPAPKITELLAWYDRRKARRRRTPVQESDDGNCGDWMRVTRQSVVACLPSLVEHPDDVPSVWRKNRQPRRALWFIGEHDPMTIPW